MTTDTTECVETVTAALDAAVCAAHAHAESKASGYAREASLLSSQLRAEFEDLRIKALRLRGTDADYATFSLIDTAIERGEAALVEATRDRWVALAAA